MPHTDAFFASPLGAAFGEDECPITQERADHIPGGVLLMHGKPYGRAALLRWMAQGGAHPLTRAPLRIGDMHTVMTPDTRMADYTQTVQALGARGWDGGAEVQSDLDWRCPGWERDVDGNVMRQPFDALREALRLNPWWRFTHTADRQKARRDLDLRMVRRALGVGADGLQYVTRVLENRRRMWRFPPGAQTFPIYMDVDVLAHDIAAISNGLAADDLRRLAHYVAFHQGFTLAHTQLDAALQPRLCIVLYPPDAAAWLQRIAIPFEMGEARAWWRRPHRLKDVLDRLVVMQTRCPVRFYFNRATFRDAATRSLTKHERQMLYERPRGLVDGAFLVHEVDRWLLHHLRGAAQMNPPPNHHNNDNEMEEAWETADGHAQQVLRLRQRDGDACPFSLWELSEAVERVYVPRGPLEAYSVPDSMHGEGMQPDPMLLPSGDPYEDPRLRPALQYGLECIEAEARVNAPY
jgi:hypothetical protein